MRGGERRQHRGSPGLPDRQRQPDRAIRVEGGACARLQASVDDVQRQHFTKRRGLRAAELAQSLETLEVDAQRAERQQRLQRVAGGLLRQRGEFIQTSRAAPTPIRCKGVDHRSAADGSLRRRIAHDEAVTEECRDRLLQHQLHKPAVAGLHLMRLQQRKPRIHRGRADMDLNRSQVRDRTRMVWEQRHLRIDAICRRMHAGRQQPLTAPDIGIAQIGANDIDRAALAGLRRLGRPVVGVDAADPD